MRNFVEYFICTYVTSKQMVNWMASCTSWLTHIKKQSLILLPFCVNLYLFVLSHTSCNVAVRFFLKVVKIWASSLVHDAIQFVQSSSTKLISNTVNQLYLLKLTFLGWLEVLIWHTESGGHVSLIMVVGGLIPEITHRLGILWLAEVWFWDHSIVTGSGWSRHRQGVSFFLWRSRCGLWRLHCFFWFWLVVWLRLLWLFRFTWGK